MLVACAATLEMVHLQQGRHSQILPSLALARRIVAVGLGEVEVVGILEDEEDRSITTTVTDIMILEIARQTARTGRAVDRLYGETEIYEMNEILTGGTVMIVGFLGSTILT